MSNEVGMVLRSVVASMGKAVVWISLLGKVRYTG